MRFKRVNLYKNKIELNSTRRTHRNVSERMLKSFVNSLMDKEYHE